MYIRKITLILINAIILSLLANTANAKLFGASARENSDLTEFPKWISVMQRIKIEEYSCNKNRNCNLQSWYNLIREQKSNPDKLASIKAVNRFINEIKYVDDIKGWNESDYWQTPYEFFKNGGDCEDYSIAKFITLLKIGFSNDDMRIVILNNERVKNIHAVLVVTIDGKDYLLDNQIPIVVEANDIHYYSPIYSLNETSWWRYNS
ncbi:MAG: conserved periplasmic protein of unknown function [Rickettsiaceae bacterium]|jgi:predicted transglutaminase-like cysteine proteinase|nr:conserved periplasmic protein of unknown function [Rickettsiaceae bacterium]